MKLKIITLLIVATCLLNSNAQIVSIDKSLLAGTQNKPVNGVTITDSFSYSQTAMNVNIIWIIWCPSIRGLFKNNKLL